MLRCASNTSFKGSVSIFPRNRSSRCCCWETGSRLQAPPRPESEIFRKFLDSVIHLKRGRETKSYEYTPDQRPDRWLEGQKAWEGGKILAFKCQNARVCHSRFDETRESETASSPFAPWNRLAGFLRTLPAPSSSSRKWSRSRRDVSGRRTPSVGNVRKLYLPGSTV